MIQTAFQGGSLTWHGPSLLDQARLQVLRQMTLGVETVRAQVLRNVSRPSRQGRSKPGEYPHSDTGRLRNSIFGTVDSKTLKGTVGTNLVYGLYLEFGTKDHVIRARPGRFLSWIGADGVRRFARQVRVKGIQGRSYLRRTLTECQPTLQRIFGQQWGQLKLS